MSRDTCELCRELREFLFVTTQYLQDSRGLSALQAGLCLLPMGVLIACFSPATGRVVGARGPRGPLVVAGVALALGGVALLLVTTDTPLLVLVAIYLLFGVLLATVNPPISNTAVAGMPRSMAGVAGSVASVGRQTGTALGVAISGAMLGDTHGLWGLVAALGAGIVVLGLLGTGRWAQETAGRFAEVERPAVALRR